MKEYEEIRRILVDELGFGDLAAYKAWVENVRPTSPPTKTSIERLSPDGVDARAFWKVCDDLFGRDPVCNVAVPPRVGRLPYEIESVADANRMNLRLAKSLGIPSFLEENSQSRLKVLEIGAGYGSLKNWIETSTNHVYVGVDVVPRVAGVVESTADGSLPRDLVVRESGTFSYVVSTNVFQHLSQRQRERYVADAHQLLRSGGLFIFNLTVDTGKIPTFARDEAGNAWSVRYGQYTPIPRGPAAYALVAESFSILYVTQRYDGLFNFVCQRS